MKKILNPTIRTFFPKCLFGLLKPALLMLVLVVMGSNLSFGQISVQVLNSTPFSTVEQNNSIWYNVPQGPSRMLLVTISNANGRTASTITFNGTSLTPAVTGNSDQDGTTQIFRLLNPPTGPGNLVVNFSGAVGRGAVIGAITLGNVDQTTPIPYSSSTSGTAVAISHSVTSENGQLVLQVVGTRQSPLTTPGASQTELWNLRPGTSEHYGAASHKTATGSSTTMTWERSAQGNSWSMSLVSVKPSCIMASVSVTNPTCAGGPNGSITVSSPVGGSGTYEYRLNTGTWQSSNTFTGLAPGTYSVQIRDANNTACAVTLGSYTLITSAVVLENSAFTTIADGTNATTISMAYNPGSAANSVMLVAVTTSRHDVTAATFGDDPLELLGNVNNGNSRVVFFYMVDPPPVAAALEATVVSDNRGFVLAAATFSNVDLNNPLNTFASLTGSTINPTINNVPTSPGSMVFSAVSYDNSSHVYSGVGPVQTELWNFANSGNNDRHRSVGSRKTIGSGTTTSMSYNIASGESWSAGAVSLNAVPVADLSIAKSVNIPGPYVGQEINFTLTATNLGCDDALNTVVLDALPSGYIYVSHSTAIGTYNPGSGEWAIGTLSAGSPATLTITAVVNSSGIYNNIATISSDAVDNDMTNNTASISITLCQAGGTQPLFSK